MEDPTARLSAVREQGLLPDDAVGVYLVGSLARGWASPQSDVDIAVFATSEWESDTSTPLPIPLSPSRVMAESFYAGDRRWEVMYWLTGQVDQILAKVSWRARSCRLAARSTIRSIPCWSHTASTSA